MVTAFASSDSYPIKPIGFIKTEMQSKFQAPHQPNDPHARPGTIELLPESNFEACLHDLDGFEYIWLLWLAHKNTTWRPKVLPPRGVAKRRGVFATRSPHRPNPIGLTAVPLLEITGRIITIGECDLINGTPILDIKPYLPEVDSFPTAKIGWVGEVEKELSKPVSYQMTIDPNAQKQLDWLLENWRVDFLDRARQLLERDPTPHRARRITRVNQDSFRMGCGPWRIVFSVAGDQILVTSIEPGYPRSSLFRKGFECIADRDAQVAFYDFFQLRTNLPAS